MTCPLPYLILIAYCHPAPFIERVIPGVRQFSLTSSDSLMSSDEAPAIII